MSPGWAEAGRIGSKVAKPEEVYGQGINSSASRETAPLRARSPVRVTMWRFTQPDFRRILAFSNFKEDMSGNPASRNQNH